VITVSATGFVKNFGQYKEQAQREVIAITSHGRTSGYFLSEQEYREYQLIKASARRVYHVSELPEETFAAIAQAKMNPAHDHLNALMD
jgi:PHD/YefM family antitoxin component YafN of YafNO toxin-antitoxin module